MVADFRVDVANPDNITAENMVGDYLRHRFGDSCVMDCRGQNLAWDFKFLHDDAWHTLDVKCDQHIHDAGNFPFEVYDLYLSTWAMRPTWGINIDLDFLAAVDKYLATAYIAPMRDVRSVVRRCYRSRDWKVWGTLNRSGYITWGIAVPLAVLRREGVRVTKVDLITLEKVA